MSTSAEGAAPGPERAAEGVSAIWELETPIPEGGNKLSGNTLKGSDAKSGLWMADGSRCGMLPEEARRDSIRPLHRRLWVRSNDAQSVSNHNRPVRQFPS